MVGKERKSDKKENHVLNKDKYKIIKKGIIQINGEEVRVPPMPMSPFLRYLQAKKNEIQLSKPEIGPNEVA